MIALIYSIQKLGQRFWTECKHIAGKWSLRVWLLMLGTVNAKHTDPGVESSLSAIDHKNGGKTEWSFRILDCEARWPLLASCTIGLQTLMGRNRTHSEGTGWLTEWLISNLEAFSKLGFFSKVPLLHPGAGLLPQYPTASPWLIVVLIFSFFIMFN